MHLRRRRSGDEAADRWVVVGLGNPGDRYARTRHNAGYLVIDRLLDQTASSLKRHKSGCLVAEVRLAGQKAVLVRTATYMNESGRTLRALMDFYKTDASSLVVVHDELDIPFGDVRVKSGGGTAGHNGLKSISNHLGTKEFLRVRVGIGRPPGGMESADYVLTELPPAQRRELPDVVGRAADAVERIIEVGPERAMNEFNTR